MRGSTLVWGGLLASLFLACGGDNDGGGNPDTVTGLVGVDGATLEMAGGAKLVIPAGALTETVEIRITKLEVDDVAALPAHVEAAGKPYAFEPFSLVLAVPAKLTVPFEGGAASVSLMKLPNRTADTSQWTTVFPNQKVDAKVSGDLTRLGVLLAVRPRRGSGVITLPDGAIVEDAATPDSSVSLDSGVSDASVEAAVDAQTDAEIDPSGPWVWLRQFGVVGSSADAVAVKVDGAGAVVFAGTVEGALLGQTAVGNRDAFVRKCDNDGVALWTHQFGTLETTNVAGVGVDSAGSVFVAGSNSGTLAGQTSAGDVDAFVRKYAGDGTELWTRQFGSSGRDNVLTATADSAGNVYVAGYLIGALPAQTNAGSFDAFVRKYDGDGTELWTRQFGSTGFDTAWGLAADAAGNVYVSGRAGAALPGQTQVGDDDAYVRKYDSAGVELWTRQFGSDGSDEGKAVAVDTVGNVVIVGETSATFSGQTSLGVTDVFVRKYDSAGVELSTWQVGSTGEDEVSAVAIDATNNDVVITGRTRASDGVSSQGTWDVYVRKHDNAGALLWVQQFGTTEPDVDGETGNDVGAGVAVDAARNVFVVGASEGPLLGQSASGYRDAFITKFAP